eukprot:14507539-Alexandrium_andersonii.AAC.1
MDSPKLRRAFPAQPAHLVPLEGLSGQEIATSEFRSWRGPQKMRSAPRTCARCKRARPIAPYLCV